MVLFFQLIYGNTERVGDWDRWQYLFFMGTGMILNGILETVFVGNCSNMAELIRTGDLDLHLAKPVDEQFLLSCRNVDWSEIFNIFVGIGLCIFSLVQDWRGSVARSLPAVLRRSDGQRDDPLQSAAGAGGFERLAGSQSSPLRDVVVRRAVRTVSRRNLQRLGAGYSG